jgi:excisionase family DNA binding protein
MSDEPRYLTPAAFARRLSVHRDTVYGWKRDGMPSLPLGRAWRVPVAEAEAWLAARTTVDEAKALGRFVESEVRQ